MRTRRLRFQAGRQSGVGLIEVLIAVLVLSIGFLGVGALLATSMSTNNSAMARSMATVASYSILDAMRADLSSAVGGAYNTSEPIKASACPDGSGSMAAAQLNQWCQQLAQGLGAAATTTGNIACTAATSGTTSDCTITITFDDSRAGAGGSNVQKVITRAML